MKHRTGSAETINPDHIVMHRLIVAGVLVTLIAAVMTSWNGLAFVASWQELPESLRWLTPLMIDVPLVVLTCARGALRKRGVRARGMLAGIIALTAYSSLANLAHTVDLAGFSSVSAVVGGVTNALAPWLILAMTEVLWLVVTRAPRPAPAKPKPRRKPAT
ncbi:hypothetical protein ASF93_08735 [Microbacterium sp. Leaf347]|nr:hypothetical protein ASF93_08735 [Microbacterium sp. Leaf347]